MNFNNKPSRQKALSLFCVLATLSAVSAMAGCGKKEEAQVGKPKLGVGGGPTGAGAQPGAPGAAPQARPAKDPGNGSMSTGVQKID